MVHQFMIMAQSGPTHTNQPPFSWKTSDFADTVRHEGHPDVFDFEALTTNWWNWQKCSNVINVT